MTNSEKSIEATDMDILSIYENDIEEIIVEGSEEEQEDNYSEQAPKLFVKENEYDSKKSMSLMYQSLQKLLGSVEIDEPQTRIIKKATSACKQLCQEELNLKYETEALLQKNWKLKRRVEKLQRKKRRKTGSATTGRRLSGPVVPSPNKTCIEKRSASIDESKLVILHNNPFETPSGETESDETGKIPKPVSKTAKRKVKKRSGLSEEEKEFYKVEEKIEDLLYEIDALWNDVKSEEEIYVDNKNVFEDVKLIDTTSLQPIKSSGPSHDTFIPTGKEKIKVTDISKLMQPELNPKKNKDVMKAKSILKPKVPEPQPLKNKEIIKITNINKLLDPIQNPILTTCNSPSFINIMKDKRRSSTSGDESPRLVIDENPPFQANGEQSKLNQSEINVMEALQAVDTLCLSLVSDEPTTSEPQPIMVDMNKVNNDIDKSDVIAISDSEDETANSDIVCIE